jgi:hypothetical protein
MKSNYLQKIIFLLCLLLMFGCASFQYENDMVMGDFNGKVKTIKKYNLNDTVFPGNIIEYSRYDRLGRLIYKGYSEISTPDSILRHTAYHYKKNSEEITHYEGFDIEYKDKFIKKKSEVLYIHESQNKKDTTFDYCSIDANGKVIMSGIYMDKGKYERYKKYNKNGEIIEAGTIEYSADSSIKKIPMFYFIYNSDGCIVKTEHSKDSYTTYFKSDSYCNLEEVYGVDDKGVVKDKDVFINILDHHNNWIKRYCLNSKNDTLYIQVREIEYYR